MSPAIYTDSSPDQWVILHYCEVCGKPASFGFNVNLRKAMATGKVEHAGQWYCAEHLNTKGQK